MVKVPAHERVLQKHQVIGTVLSNSQFEVEMRAMCYEPSENENDLFRLEHSA